MRTFVEWPKIYRLNREVIITEKIDGTNACVVILEDDIYAQSRSRIITPEDDNFGFARWVEENKTELRNGLGVGHHFGEWWGRGIQRGYGLKERRFSLFNTYRWTAEITDNYRCVECPVCHVVPILAGGSSLSVNYDKIVSELAESGSVASSGFSNPEGIVVFHTPSQHMYKITCTKDSEHKGTSSAEETVQAFVDNSHVINERVEEKCEKYGIHIPPRPIKGETSESVTKIGLPAEPVSVLSKLCNWAARFWSKK